MLANDPFGQQPVGAAPMRSVRGVGFSVHSVGDKNNY